MSTRMVDTNSYTANSDQLLFFHINSDESIVLIAEVVLVAVNSLHKVDREVGLGWALLDLSELDGAKDISTYSTNNLSRQMASAELFSGSPRILLTETQFSEDSLLFSSNLSHLSFSCFVCRNGSS